MGVTPRAQELHFNSKFPLGRLMVGDACSLHPRTGMDMLSHDLSLAHVNTECVRISVVTL